MNKNKPIGAWLKSMLIKRHPHVDWKASMSIKLANYLLQMDCRHEHYISWDDNNNLALYERDY